MYVYKMWKLNLLFLSVYLLLDSNRSHCGKGSFRCDVPQKTIKQLLSIKPELFLVAISFYISTLYF